jgi:hypothetical protein
MGRKGVHKEEAMPSFSIYGCPRGLSPLPIFVPLSKNGEGDTGGEVDKRPLRGTWFPLRDASTIEVYLVKNRALLFPRWFVINDKQREKIQRNQGGSVDNEKQNT